MLELLVQFSAGSGGGSSFLLMRRSLEISSLSQCSRVGVVVATPGCGRLGRPLRVRGHLCSQGPEFPKKCPPGHSTKFRSCQKAGSGLLWNGLGRMVKILGIEQSADRDQSGQTTRTEFSDAQ